MSVDRWTEAQMELLSDLLGQLWGRRWAQHESESEISHPFCCDPSATPWM